MDDAGATSGGSSDAASSSHDVAASSIPELPEQDEPPKIPDFLLTPAPTSPLDPRRKKTTGLAGGLSDLGPALAIGLNFLFSIAGGAFAGWLIDRYRGKGNVGMIVGLIVGFATGTWRIIRTSSESEKREGDARRGKKR